VNIFHLGLESNSLSKVTFYGVGCLVGLILGRHGQEFSFSSPRPERFKDPPILLTGSSFLGDKSAKT
jgi:hypothetical protein